jgi:cytosine/adenosine deaminase-related metal-dependent hydrolase
MDDAQREQTREAPSASAVANQPVDVLVASGLIITMDAGRRILRGSIAIAGDRITAVVPDGGALPAARRTLDATNHLVIPGLVNAHDHLRSPTPGVRLAAGLKLDDYLRVIWSLQQHMTLEDFRLGAQLGCARLLRGGCTTVVDHGYPYHCPGIDSALIETYRASGIRWYYARGMMTKPFKPLQEPRREAIDHIEALLAEGVPADRLMVAPVSFRQATAADFRAARRLADRHGLRLHTHIAETKDEVAASLKDTGYRPVEHLHHLGWTGSDVTLVHCILLSAREIDLLAKSGTTVVHCPSNHMLLAKGVTKVPRLLARGIPVALGLDFMDSMLLELRLEVLMQSLANLDPRQLTPDTALAMATLHSARSCGAEDAIGSIEVGKNADLAMVRLGRLHLAPMLNPVHVLIHMAHEADIDTVLVDGRVVVEGGKVQGIDEEALAAEMQARSRCYLERAGHQALLPAYLP